MVRVSINYQWNRTNNMVMCNLSALIILFVITIRQKVNNCPFVVSFMRDECFFFNIVLFVTVSECT